MNAPRFRFVTATLVPLAILLAACGGGGSTNTGTAGTSMTPAPATGSGGQAKDGISTTEVTDVGTVLVNADGFTLYYLQTDTHSEVTCTGGCAQTWPPVLVTEVPDATELSGKLGTIASPSGGDQLTYEGWPLYTYAGDSQPGQVKGQGVGGVWFAMTPDGPGSGGDPTGGKY